MIILLYDQFLYIKQSNLNEPWKTKVWSSGKHIVRRESIRGFNRFELFREKYNSLTDIKLPAII